MARVRREACKLYWRGVRGECAASDASKLANVLGLIAMLLRDDMLEGRIAVLEARIP